MSSPVKTESLSRPRRISDARLAARLLRQVRTFALPSLIAREVGALLEVLGPAATFRAGDVTLVRADGAAAPGAVRVHLAGEGRSGTTVVRGYVTAVATIGPKPRLLRIAYRWEHGVDAGCEDEAFAHEHGQHGFAAA